MRAWPHDLIWVRVEGHHDDREPRVPRALACPVGGQFDRAADDALMAAMHAVEHADGDDGRTPVFRHFIQAVPAVHAPLLPAIIGGVLPGDIAPGPSLP